MRYIEEVGTRNKHKGERIWIVGAGPSLDDFPDDNKFFDDKISIRLNSSISRYPLKEDYHYYHYYHRYWGYYIEKLDPELFKRCILLLPHAEVSEGRIETPEQFGKYKEYPIWMRHGSHASDVTLRESVKAIVEGKLYPYTGYGTVAHTAIQAAFIMGAKEVVLVGCELRFTPGKDHAIKDGMAEMVKGAGKTLAMFDDKEREIAYKKLRIGTQNFAREFGKYGLVIRRYYYSPIEGQGWEDIA